MTDPLKRAPFPMVLGYYDEHGELHDPGAKGLCVYCGQPMKVIDAPFKSLLLSGREQHNVVVTLGLSTTASGDRCFFYRFHRPCWDRASTTDKEGIYNYLSRSIRNSSK